MLRKERRAGEKRRLIRSITGIVVLIVGLTLALFPYLTNAYTRYFLAEPVQEEIAELLERVEEEEESPLIIPPPQEPAETPVPAQEDAAPPQYPEALLPGEGVLKIAALDLLLNIGYGVELRDLRKGPGFYPQSGYPATGNVAIAGHRTTYGAPFRHVDRLQAGDEIMLYYGGKVYVYGVESVFETHTRDWSVIDPTPAPALTLTTCHPPGWATKRLIVRAYLEDSMQVDW